LARESRKGAWQASWAAVWAGALALAAGTAAAAASDTPDLVPPWADPAIQQAARAAATTLPTDAAAPFILPSAGRARDRAVACLTSAVYYEAATEPRAGQEAVAQVVLNRLKHPAYPKTVCGVVYEGATRATGCQFTFTCDGSLGRPPVERYWAAARDVAVAALGGHVAADVGASTHYHAVWISPYWQSSLVETRRIGHHVFYRMPGQAGAPDTLTGQYSGDEPEIPRPSMALPAAVAQISDVRHRAPVRRKPAPTDANFSIWGLDIAHITASHGKVMVDETS
jgi:spore germination cell wall hydrolase CwlJ-like protein